MASGSWLQNKTTQRKNDEKVVDASVCDSVKERERTYGLSPSSNV